MVVEDIDGTRLALSGLVLRWPSGGAAGPGARSAGGSCLRTGPWASATLSAAWPSVTRQPVGWSSAAALPAWALPAAGWPAAWLATPWAA